jgi:hypothetical protein
MYCLFCKENSDNSTSIEHIIPESLGNKDHILSRGIVCDTCNNYFAIKVEKPLLEIPYFKNVRHRARIENKKGKIPIERAIIISPEFLEADINISKNGQIFIDINSSDSERISKFFSSKGALIIPAIPEPAINNYSVSRFLAKVGIEALLFKLIHEEGWIDEIMNKPELEEIKKYARYGVGISIWPYYQRRLYSEDTRFNNPFIEIANYEVLHEFNILLTEKSYCYLVIAIMGIEYSINLAAPEIDSYIEWLKKNNYKSILDDTNETKSIDNF